MEQNQSIYVYVHFNCALPNSWSKKQTSLTEPTRAKRDRAISGDTPRCHQWVSVYVSSSSGTLGCLPGLIHIQYPDSQSSFCTSISSIDFVSCEHHAIRFPSCSCPSLTPPGKKAARSCCNAKLREAAMRSKPFDPQL